MNTAEVLLLGPTTTATPSPPVCKGPREVAATGAGLRLHSGQMEEEDLRLLTV